MSADIPVEEAKAQLLAIQKSSIQNQKCMDCNAPSPTWASPMYGSIDPLSRFRADLASLHLFTVFRCPSIVGCALEFRKKYYYGPMESRTDY